MLHIAVASAKSVLCVEFSWAEQDPMTLLSTVANCMQRATAAAKEKVAFSSEQMKAIGVTNQRETVVVWDRQTGKPLQNAVVWLDTRTSDVVQAVGKELGSVDALRARCGLPIATYFSAVKLRWLYENIDVVRTAFDAGTCLVGTVDSWLIWVRCMIGLGR
jgi:glycerol kinase